MFVIGQFILKLVLEPIVEFKKVLGEVSALFLREQASITNANASETTKQDIVRLSAMLLSVKQSVPLYNRISKIFALPSEADLISGCGELNWISYHVVSDGSQIPPDKNYAFDINRKMKTLGEALNIKVSYGL